MNRQTVVLLLLVLILALAGGFLYVLAQRERKRREEDTIQDNVPTPPPGPTYYISATGDQAFAKLQGIQGILSTLPDVFNSLSGFFSTIKSKRDQATNWQNVAMESNDIIVSSFLGVPYTSPNP